MMSSASCEGACQGVDGPVKIGEEEPSLNLILLTVNESLTLRRILHACGDFCATRPSVRLTVADGANRQALGAETELVRRATGGDLRYVHAVDIRERVRLAMAADKTWTLFIADDDPFNADYLDAFFEGAQLADDATNMVAAGLHISVFPQKVVTQVIPNLQQNTAQQRLSALYKEVALPGPLYYSLIRSSVVATWWNYFDARSIFPSYTDWILVSYAVATGKLLVPSRVSALVRDETNWSSADAIVTSDAKFYPKAEFTLFHEIFWVRDLVNIVDSLADAEGVLCALRSRILQLLQNQQDDARLRCKVLRLDIREYLSMHSACEDQLRMLNAVEEPRAWRQCMRRLANAADMLETVLLQDATAQLDPAH